MSELKIRIDTRFYRICVHRQTLRAIGDPPFLNFSYEPDSRLLIVSGKWVDDRKSVRVRYDNSGSVYVFSKALLLGIQKASHILMGHCSYLAEGEVMESGKAIIFPLGLAQKLTVPAQNSPSDGTEVP